MKNMPNFRVIFSKDDVLIYISHLDLNHAFIRALNRADVKLKFSEGFNPHPKIVFALPLSVGMAGENEILDIGVADEAMTAQRLMEILSAEMPPHITIKQVCQTEKKLKDVYAAKYRTEICVTGIKDELEKFFSSQISVLKKTKGGEKDVCISTGIRSVKVSEEDGKTVILSELCAAADTYLNPELLIRAMKDRKIIDDDIPYTMTRLEILYGSNESGGEK